MDRYAICYKLGYMPSYRFCSGADLQKEVERIVVDYGTLAEDIVICKATNIKVKVTEKEKQEVKIRTVAYKEVEIINDREMEPCK